jgi:hypothetical protein
VDLKAELKGGPADGDYGLIAYAPPKLYVAYCENCKEWHWDSQREPGDEVYVKQSGDGLGEPITYSYRDIDLHGLDELDRRAERDQPVAA